MNQIEKQINAVMAVMKLVPVHRSERQDFAYRELPGPPRSGKPAPSPAPVAAAESNTHVVRFMKQETSSSRH